ncbi:MAG TPA: linear amide C-N hydrolase, partial [Bacteroidales bacterium]|nr:linear amide C-N hydrolase [Bacteroidales bacterium]
MIILQFVSLGQGGFDCQAVEKEYGMDIMTSGQETTSARVSLSDLLNGSEVIYCPAGIKRSSPDDVKKRWSFDWNVKYNTIYIKNASGLVLEGMNAHGFSASLMYLENSGLPEKEKQLIPIAASMVINFFIDHFKSIDTALLAVWDTRIFDDIGKECGWPFRIVLHDSTGASAYIEHIKGELRVYTPDPPAIVPAGSDYARLITIKHLEDYTAEQIAERDFLHFDKIITDFNEDGFSEVKEYYLDSGKSAGNYFWIIREHDE